MTIDQLISKLQKIKEEDLSGNGNVDVELRPIGNEYEYGVFDNVEDCDYAEDEYDFFEKDYATVTKYVVNLYFMRGYYR